MSLFDIIWYGGVYAKSCPPIRRIIKEKIRKKTLKYDDEKRNICDLKWQISNLRQYITDCELIFQ